VTCQKLAKTGHNKTLITSRVYHTNYLASKTERHDYRQTNSQQHRLKVVDQVALGLFPEYFMYSPVIVRAPISQ